MTRTALIAAGLLAFAANVVAQTSAPPSSLASRTVPTDRGQSPGPAARTEGLPLAVILGRLAKLPYTLRMDAKTRARFEARARVLKALAHPSRLFMVDVLARGERCVGELTEMVGGDMSTVSKHLSVLKGAGIVADEKRGMQVFYTLKVPCVLRFFDCVSEVIARSAEEQAERAAIN